MNTQSSAREESFGQQTSAAALISATTVPLLVGATRTMGVPFDLSRTALCLL